ncbi:MAG: hypothetical protein AB7O52_16025 [Planctomycetota bacterium]
MSSGPVSTVGPGRSTRVGSQALFLIGIATLVPELVWARQLGELVGSDLEGISTTLSAYLLGSSIGLWLGSRSRFPARHWGWLTVASFTLGAIWCGWWAAEWSVGGTFLASPWGRMLLAVPIVPYALTLSAMIPSWFRVPWNAAEGAGLRAGGWIAALDLGAAFGAMATPLVLLPWLGPGWTLVAVLGVLLAGQSLSPPGAGPSSRPNATVDRAQPPAGSSDAGVRLALAGLAGGVGLALQVVWTRLLGEILGTSLVILGLAAGTLLLGGAIGSRAAPVWLATIPRGRLVYLSWCVWLAAQGVSAWVVAAAPHIYLWAIERMPEGESALPIKLAIVVAALLPAGIAAGLSLPVLLAGWGDAPTTLARDAGRLQAAGLLGGTFGALAVGFWLVPRFGSGATVLCCGGLTLAGAGLALARVAEARSARSRLAIAAIAIAGLTGVAACRLWQPALLGAGVFQWSRADVTAGGALAAWHKREILYCGEGRLARVTIERASDLNATLLRVGGRVEGSVAIDPTEPSLAHLPTVSLLGVLPTLLRGDGAHTLIIGVGGGTTVATAVQAGNGPITALEVEPEVLSALRSSGGRAGFPWETRRLFAEPLAADSAPSDRESPAASPPDAARRLPTFIAADARAYLHRTREQWDAIVCQPSEPWLPWSAPLFTRAFFERVHSRLRPDGVAIHWLQLYRIDFPEFGAILRGFRDVFPEVLVFHPHPATGEVVLVGAATPIDPALWVERWQSSRLSEVRARAGWPDGVPWPLLDTGGVDRWLAGESSEGGGSPPASRNLLEHRLAAISDRGVSYAGEILRSLVEAGSPPRSDERKR